MKKITLAVLLSLAFTAAQAGDASATCSVSKESNTCVTAELAGWGAGVNLSAIAKQYNFDERGMGSPKIYIRDQSGLTLANKTGSGGVAAVTYRTVAAGKQYKARGYKGTDVTTATKLDVTIKRY
jgi:hypothetical protein